MSEAFAKWFELGVAVVAVFSGLFIGGNHAVRYIRQRYAVRNQESFNHVNMRLWEVLSELRIKSKSSRVSLIQFHNGGKFADGSSMRKMSISHQSCDNKTSSTMQFRQDVLVSRFVEVIQQLRDNEPHIRNVRTMLDSNTKKFYELHDTLAYCILPLFCSDSLVVYGYITIEWCDTIDIDNVDEKDIQHEFDYARHQVSFLLNSAKDYR